MPGLLRNLDLNLLVIFDVLWAERSVSRTAQRVGRTQSAVSLALERLRSTFGDPLFVWNGHAMQPTGNAEQLAPRIRAIVNRVNEAMDLQFQEPRMAHREFTIATADYIDWLVGGKLMRRLEDEAPNLTLYFVDVKPFMAEGRGSAEVELFIVPRGVMNTAAMSQQPLFRDRYIGVAARDNDAVYEGMSVAEFMRIPQATYTANPKMLFSHETSHLAELGVHYRNRVLTPHYMALPMIVAESRGIVVMQERLARFMSRLVPLKLFRPPVHYPELELNLYWNRQLDDDPTHRWLRERIVEIAAGIPPLPPLPPLSAGAAARARAKPNGGGKRAVRGSGAGPRLRRRRPPV